MQQRLQDLFDAVDDQARGQQQREAMLDLLLWTMYADRRLALPENDRIDELEMELTWEAVTPVRQYLHKTFARVRDVLSDDEAAEGLLRDITARLGTPEACRRAYAAAEAFAVADGEVADEEARLLTRLRAAFGLDHGPDPGMDAET